LKTSVSKKSSLGQFYTTNAEYIVGDLLDVIPAGSVVVDPFAGNWDLLRLVDNPVEAYDLDPQNRDTEKRDTLFDPPSYKDKWILTNPPYLARNKSKNKVIFDKYEVSDLYQAALDIIAKSECLGGVVIVPLNFLCAEENKVRKALFCKYKVVKLKIFEEQVFDDTSYTVCAFSFIKSVRGCIPQTVDAEFLPSHECRSLSINHAGGYRLGSEAQKVFSKKSSAKISRLLKGQRPNTRLFLRALDTGAPGGRIALKLDKPYYGKETDRAFATISVAKAKVKLTIYRQRRVAKKFNKKLEALRSQYNSLFLTNFRNSTAHYARKRISFEMAYGLIHACLVELGYAEDLKPSQMKLSFGIEVICQKK